MIKGNYNDELNFDKGHHKEEGMRRKQNDASDRNKIISKLKKYTNPLQTKAEDELMNIVSG